MITPEDFQPLAELVKTYELKPGFHYLVICDGKSFSHELANALFERARDMHPELHVEVIASLGAKGIKIGMKKETPDALPDSASLTPDS
jgi:hypothetical protein